MSIHRGWGNVEDSNASVLNETGFPLSAQTTPAVVHVLDNF